MRLRIGRISIAPQSCGDLRRVGDILEIWGYVIINKDKKVCV